MKYSFDPYQERLLNWKIRQNMVLQIFLNAWWNADADTRKEIGYTFATVDNSKVIVDPEGLKAVEVVVYGNTMRVAWFRSFRDYQELDRLGQAYTQKREKSVGRVKAS